MAKLTRYPYPAPQCYPNWLRLCLSLLVLLSLWLWPPQRLPLQGAWQWLLAGAALLPWFPRTPKTSPFLLAEDGSGLMLAGGETFELDRRSWVLGTLVLLRVQPQGQWWWLRRGQMDRAGWRRLCRILVRVRLSSQESGWWG